MRKGGKSLMKGAVDPFVQKEIVQRIVACADPEKSILFGSGARDQKGAVSDTDLLVIKNGVFDAGKLTEEIYMRLIGIGKAADVVVISASDAIR
jgi:hypothetical protein